MLVACIAAIAIPIIASIGDIISLIWAYTVGHRWFITKGRLGIIAHFLESVLAS